MRENWKKGLAGMMLAALLATGTACESEGHSGGEDVDMTEMVRSALVLAGADMENFSETSPRESEKSLMASAAYLEKTLGEKYPGTAFEMTACVRQSIAQGYDEYVLVSGAFPEEPFVARVWSDKDGLHCTDAYYGVAFRSDYEAWVKEKLAQAEPDAQVFSTIDFQFDETCGAAMSVEQAARQPGFFSFTWILIPDDGGDFEKRAEAVWKAVESAEMTGDFALYGLCGEWKAFSREEVFRLIPSHSDKQPVYAAVDRLIRR